MRNSNVLRDIILMALLAAPAGAALLWAANSNLLEVVVLLLLVMVPLTALLLVANHGSSPDFEK